MVFPPLRPELSPPSSPEAGLLSAGRSEQFFGLARSPGGSEAEGRASLEARIKIGKVQGHCQLHRNFRKAQPQLYQEYVMTKDSFLKRFSGATP